MSMPNPYSEKCAKKLKVDGKDYSYFDLTSLHDQRYGKIYIEKFKVAYGYHLKIVLHI